MTSTNPRYYAGTTIQPTLSGARVTVVAVFIGLFLLAIAGRAFVLQVLDTSAAIKRGDMQLLSVDRTQAPRGLITDRNGAVLAVSNLRTTVRLYPDRDPVTGKSVVTDTATLATAVAAAAGRPRDQVKRQMDNILETWSPNRWISTVIADGLSVTQTFQLTTTLANVKRCCVSIDSVWGRDYPQETLASSVLGYVNLEPQGMSGVEGYYDSVLRATPGYLATRGNDLQELRPSLPGADLTLTLDANLQRFVERRLAQAVNENDASGGSIIVMDTKTGSILAMASLPTYDPNKALASLQSPEDGRRLRNQAVSDVYDPGSTWKIMTWAAAIDSGKVTTKTVFNDAGVYRTDGIPIYNSQYGRYGQVSLLEVFQHSINTVTGQVAREYMGPELFYQYMRRFGVGNRTGVDMVGEEKGVMNTPESPEWSPIVLVTNSYGQGVLMTPIQVIGAVNAIANDGAYMQPHVVGSYALPNGRKLMISPIQKFQTVSPQAAREIRTVLAEATRTATPNALIKGYSVAGKTGTAEQRPNGIPVPRPIHTYAGFFPATSPRVTILVKLDYPKLPFAKDTTIPVFHDVAERAAQILSVPPDIVK